jgi:hypothetical protein
MAPPEQRRRLRHAEGHARRASAGDHERDRKLEEARKRRQAAAERRSKKHEYPFRVAGEVNNFRMADNSREAVRPTCRKRSCWLSKESNACYGPKPRFMSQSG